jgi:V/A-type H+-transporting ATPase subunit I
MLRPERMSRVSVTGSKRVMDDVVETAYDLRLLHVTEYDDSWEGFEPGDPIEGADEVSGKLVTVRALKSTLGVTGEDVSPTNRVVTDETLDKELDAVRADVNELDDRHDELRDELQDVEERIDLMEPFVALGIDLDLLSGYESLAVQIGKGDPGSVERALADSDVDAYETYAADDVVAVFAYTDEKTLADVFVDATFTAIEIPDGEGDPEEYLEELRHRERERKSKLSTAEGEMEDLKLEVGGFLLAAEEELAIDVEKREAPLAFATTENAFIAEGWIPTGRYDEFERAITDTVGDHVEIEELERADYDEDGHPVDHEEVPGKERGAGEKPGGVEQPTAANGRGADADAEEARTGGGADQARVDGGTVTMGGDEPPVVQDNPDGIKSFEALVEIINKPKYGELNPTIILFLTFPLFFGFMIGDVGYGILYLAIGYWLVTSFEGDIIRSLGGIALWAGGFTVLFGILYGEFFGLHGLGDILWGAEETNALIADLGDPPIHKGLQPGFIKYAQAWLLLSAVAGVFHLVVGRAFDLVNKLDHGVREAFTESGSWILLTVGLWLWIFSKIAASAKPEFMFTVLDSGKKAALPLHFAGFPPTVGWAGLAIAVVGLGLAFYAEGGIVLIESVTEAFGHVVSYTRLAAVLLAKAGMALAVNLLVFGATLHEGEFHLIFFMSAAPNPEEVVFGGLLNLEGPVALVGGLIAGLVILVLGHLLVLVLGITSAGLQAVRLEYVEFFGKFYEGGGQEYVPFGHDRVYTAD